MEVVIQPTLEQAVELAGRLIAARVRAKPDLVLGLATGRTMEGVYDRLVSIQQSDGLDFSRCRTFNLDEYIGIPGEDEHSYRYYMNHHLFSRVNIDRANTHVPDGMAADLQAEAARYEHLIDEAGGIDLQLLGIGEGGHIGPNVTHQGKGADPRHPTTECRHVWRRSGQSTQTSRDNGGRYHPGCARVAPVGDRRG